MNFNTAQLLTSPFMWLFATLFLGMLLGKLKIKNFSLGVAGPLFSGLILGWLAVSLGKWAAVSDRMEAPHFEDLLAVDVIPYELLMFSLILFIASVGLLAAEDIGRMLKEYGLKFAALGILMTTTGFVSSLSLAYLFSEIDIYSATGIFTGALTSSPGLAAALEAVDPTFEGALSAGFIVSYPIGVLTVITFIGLFPRILNVDLEKEQELFRSEFQVEAATGPEPVDRHDFDIPGFALICLVGYTLGQLEIPLGPFGPFSLGTTGGVFLTALLLGQCGRLGAIHFRMSRGFLDKLQRLATTLFLAIIGLRYGYHVFGTTSIYLILAALYVGSFSIVSGVFFGRYLFDLNWIILTGALCGGMTSTPGLGMAFDVIGNDDPAAGCGATYPFALLGMVIFSSIMAGLSAFI